MKRIKKINVLSLAKILGIVTGGVYLVVVIIIITVGALFIDTSSFSKFDFLGFGSTIVATFLFALLIGIINFIFGLALGWFYNLAASLVGGVSIELEEAESQQKLFEKRFDQKVKNTALARPGEESLIGSTKPQDEVNQLITDGYVKGEGRDTFKAGQGN